MVIQKREYMRKFRRYITKYQPFFPPVLLIFFSLGVILWGIIPGMQKTFEQFDQAKSVQEEIDRLKKKLAVLESLDEATLQQKLLIATSAIPLDKSLPTLLRTVETLTGQTNVTLTSVTLQDLGSLSTESAKIITADEKQLGTSIIPFSVLVSGGYDSVGQFLDQSTRIRRIIHARTFTLNLESKDQLSTQILFDAFYAPLPKVSSVPELVPVTNKEEQILTGINQFANMSQTPLFAAGTTNIPTEAEKANPFGL